MKSAGKARNNGLYRHIRTSKEIIRNLLNDSFKIASLTTFKPKGAAFEISAQKLRLPHYLTFAHTALII